MHFDLVDLRLIKCIAETDSLTRGAARFRMSIPAVSTRIKNLEESIGVKLLYRTSQGVTLTEPGQAFLHHARIVLSQLEQLRGDMQDYIGGIKGSIRIFANTTAITEFLPHDLRDYLAAHPDVCIDLREKRSHDIVHSVTEGIADVGIFAGTTHPESLQVLPYREDRLVLVVSTSHTLSNRDTIEFAEAAGCAFVGMSEESAIHGFMDKVAHDLHKELHMRINVGNFEAMCRMIEADIGIGVMPRSAALRHVKTMKLKFVDLRDAWATRNLFICIRNLDELPGFAQDLIKALMHETNGENAHASRTSDFRSVD